MPVKSRSVRVCGLVKTVVNKKKVTSSYKLRSRTKRDGTFCFLRFVMNKQASFSQRKSTIWHCSALFGKQVRIMQKKSFANAAAPGRVCIPG